MIVTNVVYEDDYLMKVNIRHSYTELMEKTPKLLWPKDNGSNLKDIGNLYLNIPYP